MGSIVANVYPSLIAADILHIGDEVKQIDPYCSGYHIDIMDYQFVPNLTWGPMFPNAIRSISDNQIWIDLLVQHPERYIPDLKLHSNDIVTFHVESKHTSDIIQRIHSAGYSAGVGINPNTPVEQLCPYVSYVDHVLVMSVQPGFSGQSFVQESLDVLETVVAWREQYAYTYTIAMDGGIDMGNIEHLMRNGAQMFAVGSGIFGTSDPIQSAKKMRNM